MSIDFFTNIVKAFNSDVTAQSERKHAQSEFNPNLNPQWKWLFSMGTQSTTTRLERRSIKEITKDRCESTAGKAYEEMRSYRSSLASLKGDIDCSLNESIHFPKDLHECLYRVSLDDKDALWVKAHWLQDCHKPTKAFEYFQKAAKAGCHLAYGDLAQCYKNGNGVEKDSSKADQYYYQAYLAEQTYDYGGFGSWKVGRLFLYGLGGATRDVEKALEIYASRLDFHNDPRFDDIYNELKDLAQNSSNALEHRFKALLLIWRFFNPSKTGEIRGDNRDTYFALKSLISNPSNMNVINDVIKNNYYKGKLLTFVHFEKQMNPEVSITSSFSQFKI